MAEIANMLKIFFVVISGCKDSFIPYTLKCSVYCIRHHFDDRLGDKLVPIIFVSSRIDNDSGPKLKSRSSIDRS